MSHSRTVFLESLGCKLNQAEAEAWARQLAAMGHELASCPEEADLYILNTCAVTHAADRFPVQVGVATKRKRSQAMLALSEELSRSYRGRFLGRTLPVLWEAKKPSNAEVGDGAWVGLGGNYLRLYCRTEADLRNQLLPCRFTSLTADGLWADPSGSFDQAGQAFGGGNEPIQ